MPFQPINFAALQPQGNDFARNFPETLINSIKAGYGLAKMPERYENEKKAQEFENALKEAQAGKIIKDVNNPFYGAPSGEAGEAYNAEILEKNPKLAGAWEKYLKNKELQNRNTESNITYRNKIANTIDKARSTPLGKFGLEEQEIENGYLPGSNGTVKLTPDQQEFLRGQYALKKQKEVSDTGTRERTLYAANIDKTLKFIDPNDFTHYSGPLGATQLKLDQAQAALGHPSEQFIKYENAKTAADFLTKQVRFFYKDSIQDPAVQRILKLIDPSEWSRDPKVALSKYNTAVEILKKETETYRSATKNTEEFKEKKPSNQGVTRLYKGGKAFDIPNDKLEKALQSGYGR